MTGTLTRLTDEQMALIVEMVDASQAPAKIAKAVGADYYTVHKAVQRVKAHGWSTKLVWSICRVCNRQVADNKSRLICRSEECQRVSANRRARANRKPGESTPYVREWRERNPAKELARRIANYDSRRGQPQSLTDEQRRQHNVVARRGQRRRNEETREVADNHGQIWSSDEVQYILDHPELTNAAIAYDLGRTAQAVHGRRTLLRKRGLM